MQTYTHANNIYTQTSIYTPIQTNTRIHIQTQKHKTHTNTHKNIHRNTNTKAYRNTHMHTHRCRTTHDHTYRNAHTPYDVRSCRELGPSRMSMLPWCNSFQGFRAWRTDVLPRSSSPVRPCTQPGRWGLGSEPLIPGQLACQASDPSSATKWWHALNSHISSHKTGLTIPPTWWGWSTQVYNVPSWGLDM